MSWRVGKNKWNLRSPPWTDAIPVEYDDEENRQQAVSGVVCWTTRGGDGMSNARLIAAAPDMLAALRDIVKRNEIQHWFNLDLARAAIAKAEGAH